MSTLAWVILANAAVWAGIGGYLALLGLRQRALAARIAQLEALRHD